MSNKLCLDGALVCDLLRVHSNRINGECELLGRQKSKRRKDGGLRMSLSRGSHSLGGVSARL